VPDFSRRGFFQLLGAASVAPFLPTASRAALAGEAVSSSKALWTGLYANSGSTAKFVRVAQGMGLSNGAIQGVSARTIGVRIALATATEASVDAGAKTLRRSLAPRPDRTHVRRKIRGVVEHLLSEEDKAPLDELMELTEESADVGRDGTVTSQTKSDNSL